MREELNLHNRKPVPRPAGTHWAWLATRNGSPTGPSMFPFAIIYNFLQKKSSPGLVPGKLIMKTDHVRICVLIRRKNILIFFLRPFCFNTRPFFAALLHHGHSVFGGRPCTVMNSATKDHVGQSLKDTEDENRDTEWHHFIKRQKPLKINHAHLQSCQPHK